MNRRSFFQFLAAGAAVVQADPDKLLWKPGQKLVSIPSPVKFVSIRDHVKVGEIIWIAELRGTWKVVQSTPAARSWRPLDRDSFAYAKSLVGQPAHSLYWIPSGSPHYSAILWDPANIG